MHKKKEGPDDTYGMFEYYCPWAVLKGTHKQADNQNVLTSIIQILKIAKLCTILNITMKSKSQR